MNSGIDFDSKSLQPFHVFSLIKEEVILRRIACGLVPIFSPKYVLKFYFLNCFSLNFVPYSLKIH